MRKTDPVTGKGYFEAEHAIKIPRPLKKWMVSVPEVLKCTFDGGCSVYYMKKKSSSSETSQAGNAVALLSVTLGYFCLNYLFHRFLLVLTWSLSQ